ncbi:MAG: site-specific tyrosine recombinase [Chitinophagales bacterium]
MPESHLTWKTALVEFKAYLQLERSLAINSVEAYMRDIEKLKLFVIQSELELLPQTLEPKHCELFLQTLTETGISIRSQARILSGIKAFYKFLMLEEWIKRNPVKHLESPKIGTKVPTILSVEEINQMIAAIDLSKPEGERNKAIIEVLYGCGLRASELTSLKISNLYLQAGFVRIIGKSNKERLVPINQSALKQVLIYKEQVRVHQPIKPKMEDFLFLNRRGKNLSRVMIFNIVKQAAKEAGIQKVVSPHTFRHTFATHLYEGGADLRAIQEMLGHESITTTEIYSKIDQSYLRDTLIQFHPRFG